MELLMQGIVLMVIGMATVFAFLVLLILSMSTSAAFFRKFAHLFPEEQAVLQKSNADPAAEIAVALAAIRAKRG
jgi:sodium pump decarboxylase gamma subunit